VVFSGKDLVHQAAGLDLNLSYFFEKVSSVHLIQFEIGNSKSEIFRYGTSILFNTSCTTCSELTSSASASYVTATR
jgi:hypothetical protein